MKARAEAGASKAKAARQPRPRSGSVLEPETPDPDPIEIIRQMEQEDAICSSHYCKWVDAIVSFVSLTLVVVTTSIVLLLVPLPKNIVGPAVIFYMIGMPFYMINTWRRLLIQLMAGKFAIGVRERTFNWVVLGFLMITGFWTMWVLIKDSTNPRAADQVPALVAFVQGFYSPPPMNQTSGPQTLQATL
jgi:hypothetical protein